MSMAKTQDVSLETDRGLVWIDEVFLFYYEQAEIEQSPNDAWFLTVSQNRDIHLHSTPPKIVFHTSGSCMTEWSSETSNTHSRILIGGYLTEEEKLLPEKQREKVNPYIQHCLEHIYIVSREELIKKLCQ